MFIIIKENSRIYQYVLSEHLKYKGIEIYYKNNRYYINLKDNYYFSNNIKSDVLNIGRYEIRSKDIYYSIYLYVYDSNKGIDDFKLYANQKILIASDTRTNIVCIDPYLKENYLYLTDGIIKTNFDISVNGLAYDNNQLNEGDIIEYLGIKIVYFNDYFYINCFNLMNKLDEYDAHEAIIQYNDVVLNPGYTFQNKLIDLNIDAIKEYKLPKKQSFSEFIKGIIPNLIMSISMAGLAGVSLYSSILNNQPEYTRITYILMPISMLMTSILLPTIFYIGDRNQYKRECELAKRDYLNYLSQFDLNLEKRIKEYLDSHNLRYFDLGNLNNKIFYMNCNEDDSLTLSLGKMVVHKELVYEKTDDAEIDTKLKKIEEKVHYIEDYPLILNIKKNRIISVVCKPSDKNYLFNKFLLELAYKYHYDDLKIGVYSKDSSIFDDFFNLPHLFLNESRLTLINDKQIQELDQKKLEKPLILFVYDYLNFNFTNKNIYIIYLSNDIGDVYKNSNCVVEYLNNKAYLYKDEKIEFCLLRNDIFFKDYYSYLGRCLCYKNNNSVFHFKDIFDLNIKENYLKNNKTLSCDFAYCNGEVLSFDLHESKQGPHGLIGGCTGSGKSELIVSLLLSLCIRYSPDYLNIVLIDYKGGGIKESLSYKNECLPHIVASVSNLENNSLERLIIALNNECKLRQSLFKSLSRLSNSSIMNLDDYLNNDYEKYNLIKLAHLLIVVDEFAELKKQNPEQIKELISLSRIGRSLGVHLILATQKPSGVIDDEIWSNSHFKLALKVFDEKDSMDLIKSKDAAYLSNPGSFILRVDDSLIHGQSIYCKSDYYGNDPYRVSLLDNTLSKVNTYKCQNNQGVSECSVYIEKILSTCKEMKIKTRMIDFMPPASKNRKLLSKEKCFVFGLSDDYIRCRLSVVDFAINESILVYSGRNNEINSFLNTLNEWKRQCVVIGSKHYKGLSISDSVLYDDREDIDYLFDYLLNHKDLNLTLVIEDLNCFLSYDESYLDILCRLCRRRDSLNIGLLFISTNSQISFKLINYFTNRVLIYINDKSDISAFYGMRCGYEGNSFYFDEEPISMIPIKIETYIESESSFHPIIKRIPDKIAPIVRGREYLLGYDLISKDPVYASEDVCIVSYDADLLDSYQKAYPNCRVVNYEYNLKLKNYNELLWTGPGIFNQRLFVASSKNDLNKNEGYYIHNGHKQWIRCINYE